MLAFGSAAHAQAGLRLRSPLEATPALRAQIAACIPSTAPNGEIVLEPCATGTCVVRADVGDRQCLERVALPGARTWWSWRQEEPTPCADSTALLPGEDDATHLHVEWRASQSVPEVLARWLTQPADALVVAGVRGFANAVVSLRIDASGVLHVQSVLATSEPLERWIVQLLASAPAVAQERRPGASRALLLPCVLVLDVVTYLELIDH